MFFEILEKLSVFFEYEYLFLFLYVLILGNKCYVNVKKVSDYYVIILME